MIKNLFHYAVIALASTLGGLSTAEDTPKPNIVLMMSDDQGWGETGYNGHPQLKTPVLDEMAASGLRLDRFYATSPVCTPTRASVLTGRHANRMGAFGTNWSIRPEELTLAPLLKAAGYRTAHFGKWHVGAVKEESPLSPNRLGFDEPLSHDNFFEMNPALSRNGKPPERIEGEGSEIIVREALTFARKAHGEGKPFFLVIWFGSPHSPYECSEEDSAPYRELGQELSWRYGEITAMDRAIGLFREGLDDIGERSNTMLWFKSDNGMTIQEIPKEQQVRQFNRHLRGHKATMYDIETDKEESNDLASTQPEVVERMAAELKAWQLSVENMSIVHPYRRRSRPPKYRTNEEETKRQPASHDRENFSRKWSTKSAKK